MVDNKFQLLLCIDDLTSVSVQQSSADKNLRKFNLVSRLCYSLSTQWIANDLPALLEGLAWIHLNTLRRSKGQIKTCDIQQIKCH